MQTVCRTSERLRSFGLFLFALGFTLGCSKPQSSVKVPARLCVPNPFSTSKETSSNTTPLGIVNGSMAGNTDPLEKTVVGIIMDYSLSDGTTTGGTCTGVVAGKDVVISAAHCFKPPPNATAARVYITFKQELRNLTMEDVISAERVVRHPNYTGDNANYANSDIAVMKLSSPVPSSQLVASFVADTTSLSTGTGITAIGYGVTGTTNRDSGLKRRADSFVSNLINATNYPSSPLRDQIRVVDNSGSFRGACYGDSGGPGFVRGKAHVFGVVQGVHGSVQGTAPNCERADYNYTLVAPFMNWIEEQIGYKLNVSGEPLTVSQSPAWGGIGGSGAAGGSNKPPPSAPGDGNGIEPEPIASEGDPGERQVGASSKRSSASQTVLPYCK